ncbi:molybdopterin binding oxidoreductase [Karstenula rhodostoma CBS 690.94]|uniref:Molybdopterin binding oxidoreductase n=1 Tax=Karstenula rhodostoma CBS 690.94 TaxID=1392251 RepID=A0A9P4PXK5_9PLEO|nr:molybdopterin binding oxidoreductase [Karstenula rhodostoma CBS 690.94]
MSEKTTNRPDEWKIEQGLSGAALPVLNMTGPETKELAPQVFGDLTKNEEAIAAVGDRDKLFTRERKGWVGFVEWENYPEKKAAAHKILTAQTFPPNPEYQLGPIPGTNPITPNPLHFVRNHGGIPIINKEDYSFLVDGLVKEPRSFTLDDLMDEAKFPRVEKTATIQCSGTRRIEQILKYPGQGDEVPQAPWAEGAIGTATYIGISLKKVIKACGGLVDGAKHLEFYGADTYFKDDKVMNYLVSVPWSKVKANEVILAWEMNGDVLPRIHGYPLRLVVLGYIGARSVKWLYRIKAIKNPTHGIQIQEMPGWAYSGGGRWPERVELSADGGFNWYAVPPENLSKKRKWTWRTYEFDLPCDVEGWVEIVCRCWDNALNTQPPDVRTAWNWGLHVTSSCHRISFYSVNKTKPLTDKRLGEFEKADIPFGPVTVPLPFPSQTWEEYEKYWQEHDPRDAADEN